MPKTILIVDDDADTRTSFGEILAEYGYRIVGAADGKEALEKAHGEKPDIILLDTMLPDIDGYEVCKRIKKMKGQAARVIIYTGAVDAVDAGTARGAGADDYIVKTSDLSRLLNAIKGVT